MPVQKFPFVTDGIHGDVPINYYPAADSERGVLLQPTPGLDELTTLTNCTEVRGLFAWGSYLYAVAQRGSYSVLWRISPTGSKAELGTLITSASGPVWMFNNATQLCIVDGSTAYTYVPATNIFSQISDANFPGASSGDSQDGYGLFTRPNSNQWFFSSQFDFRTFDALDFYTAEGKPGTTVALFSFMREPFILCDKFSELWYNAGGDNSSAANPTFARNTGGVMEYGCGAAGSTTTASGTLPCWLSDKGQFVAAPGGYPQVISNQMMDTAVAGFTGFSDARTFAYRDLGHIFVVVNFPLGDQTWVWDAVTKLWHKRTSYRSDDTGFGRHRANCYALLGNKHYVGDFENGKVYEMSTQFYDDNGQEIQRVAYAKEIDGGLRKLKFGRMQLIVEPGVGLEDGTDPQVMMDFSDDGGNTWSGQVWVSAGKIGEYTRRAMWLRNGMAYKRMFRFTMTDKVLWRILAFDVEMA